MNEIMNIVTPAEMCLQTARREKARRKQMGLTQLQLASKAGVSLGSLRRFEQTGEISFHSLARIAQALECSNDFEQLFARRHFRSIQEVIDAQHN